MRRLGLVLCLAAFVGCFRNPPVERDEWPVMGTVAAVQSKRAGVSARAHARYVARIDFGKVEELLNAHVEDSEISRLATLPDAEVLAACAAWTRPCYETAFALAKQTDGAFSPRWRGTNTLDLGGVAKGFAVDRAEKSVRNETRNGDFLLDLGGNLKAVRGDWSVGIKDGKSFTLKEGEACATSARYYRGAHIVDARTRKPVGDGVHSVTVVHPTSAMLADGLSTVLFILGREKGEAFLRERHPEARAIWIMD